MLALSAVTSGPPRSVSAKGSKASNSAIRLSNRGMARVISSAVRLAELRAGVVGFFAIPRTC